VVGYVRGGTKVECRICGGDMGLAVDRKASAWHGVLPGPRQSSIMRHLSQLFCAVYP
jgi:hypothetical protein